MASEAQSRGRPVFLSGCTIRFRMWTAFGEELLELALLLALQLVRWPGYLIAKLAFRLGDKEPGDEVVWLVGIVFWVVIIAGFILWWRFN